MKRRTVDPALATSRWPYTLIRGARWQEPTFVLRDGRWFKVLPDESDADRVERVSKGSGPDVVSR